MKISLTIERNDATPEQYKAVLNTLTALEEFLFAPNEIATEKNNAMQKCAATARKLIVGETNPKKVNKKKEQK